MQELKSSTADSFAVIIVNWNAGDWLLRVVDSLFSQTVLPLEVFIVDNNSSDGSSKVVYDKYPLIRLIEVPSNIGFAAANNLAVKSVSECVKWIALLNPDAIPERTWLEELRKGVESNPSYSVFGCRLMNVEDSSVIDGVGDAYNISGLVWRECHGQNFDERYNVGREIFSPCAAAALYRKDAYLEAGGFDEDYFCYVEDVDLGFRLKLLGYRSLYLPMSVVFHAGSVTTGKGSDFSIYHGHRNLVWTFIKNMPGVLFWFMLPLHITLNLMTIIYFVIRGRGAIILKSKWDSIKGVPAMWRKRIKVQAQRRVSSKVIWAALNKKIVPLNRFKRTI